MEPLAARRDATETAPAASPRCAPSSARARGNAATCARLSARQNMRPFGTNAGIEFLARTRDDWKSVAPRPRPTGIDDDARIARIVAAIVHGIEHRAPATAQDFDAF